ncbi:MAG: hypothetical protein SGJ20_10330 [Planctomycetota bacterium]|nr:hypothetical protein [Planctomycetota bacterium]
MHFLVPNGDCLPSEALSRGYYSSREETPQRSLLEATAEGFDLHREDTESLTLTILWNTQHYGPLALTTGTLMDRERPYLLPVELARGTLNRMRNQAALWSWAGMKISDDFLAAQKEAIRLFSHAAINQHAARKAADLAEQSIDATLLAAHHLAQAYARQAADSRNRLTPRMAILQGARLDQNVPIDPGFELLIEASNTVCVPFSWKQIEVNQKSRNWELCDAQVAWCQAHRMRVLCGPLLNLHAGQTPAWLRRDLPFDELLDQATEFLQAAVQRYRGHVHLWQCAAAINCGTALDLNEEQRLRLAVKAIEVVRAADPRAPVVISFAQPWGEYLRDESYELSPIHFADALSRGDLGLSGIGLEIDLGLSSGQTLPRDPLEFSRQLDRWSSLNLPLLIFLTVPSDSSGFTLQSQADWVENYVPVLLGKQAVQAILWTQLQDLESNASDRGLFDSIGAAKPALEALTGLRR